jgi:hypothetical protein
VKLIVLTLIAASAGACFVDPVHDDEVSALGPEDPNVQRGPMHRPGQPCLVCHGGSGPASRRFSVAGTAFAVKGQTQPLLGATIALTDSPLSDGTARGGVNLATNAAGNFYVTPSDYDPYWPIHVELDFVTQSGCASPPCDDKAIMVSHIGRDGSCATCHVDPPGPSTPGRVYLYIDQASVPEGGVP